MLALKRLASFRSDPLVFLLLARMVATPGFLQLVGAPLFMFSPAFVLLLGLLPLPPLVVALVAAVRHAAPFRSSRAAFLPAFM
jgi:hypothetical protein